MFRLGDGSLQSSSHCCFRKKPHSFQGNKCYRDEKIGVGKRIIPTYQSVLIFEFSFHYFILVVSLYIVYFFVTHFDPFLKRGRTVKSRQIFAL